MGYRIILLKRIRELIRNTKNIAEFESLRDNLPYTGVTYSRVTYDTSVFDGMRYIAYIDMFKEKTITKEEHDIYREMFDLIALKTIRNTGDICVDFDFTDLDSDENN